MIMLVSQDKKAIFDFSKCFVFIPDDDDNCIYLKNYENTSYPFLLARYKDIERTKKIFQEMINELGKSKMVILKATANYMPQDLEKAKKYFESFNNQECVIADQFFDVIPTGNKDVITYKFPEDVEVENDKES